MNSFYKRLIPKGLKYLGLSFLLLCSNVVMALPQNLQAPPANANAAELADYYEQLAAHYRTLANKQKEIAHQLNASASTPQVPILPTAKKSMTPSSFAGTYAGLGYIMNTGDTNSHNLYTKGFLNYQANPNWITSLEVTYQNAYESGKGQLENKLYSDLNSVNNFDEGMQGIYGDINYTRDTFSGYAYTANESVGYNRVLYKTQKFNLSTQIGPGLQQELVQGTSNTQNDLSANFRLNSQYQISAHEHWQELLTTATTQNQTFITLDSNFTVDLFNNFALQFDLFATYDTAPLPNKVDLNTATTMSLIYNFH